MAKFTYKKHKKEGQYRSFQKGFTDIKLKGKLVGSLREVEFDQWAMAFIVDNPQGENCKWKWVTLSAQGKSEQACRHFLDARFDEIMAKFSLHPLDSD